MTTAPPTAIGTVLPASPYKGLVPYAEADAPFFFGRDEWRAIIVDNLRAYRLTLLYGESGVGKSSVLHAGVLHELREGTHRAVDAGTSPGLAVVVFRSWRDDPLRDLVRRMRNAAADALGEPLPPELAGAPDLVATIEDCAARVGGKVFVVLDQFEEYFLYHPNDDGERSFAAVFARAVNRRDLRVTFLISIREDAVAKLDRFKGRLPSLFDNYLRIEHLDRIEARTAIEQPLAEYGRRAQARFSAEPQLVDAILDDVETGKVIVGQAGAGVVDARDAAGRGRVETPYLQLVLTRLWDEERRAGSATLRLETFLRLGGAEGIVRTHLDAAMSALPVGDQDAAAELFNYLVTPSGSKIAQRVTDLAKYAGLSEAAAAPILEGLSGELRILRPVGDASYEIYHDALAAPILDWRARWHERRQRRRDRRRATVLAGVAVACAAVAVGVIVLALFAVGERNAAQSKEKQVNFARSKELAASAMTLRRSRLDPATRLAIKAYDVAATAEAEGALRAVVAQPHVDVELRLAHGTTRGAVFSPHGRFVATTTADGATRIWNAARGNVVKVLAGRSDVRNGLSASGRFSPGGDLVATLGRDGRTRIWTTRDWRRFATFAGHAGPVLSATFSRDGRRLVTTGADGTVRVWDVPGKRSIAVLRGTSAAIGGADFSPDGRRVVFTRRDSTLVVWRFAGARAIIVLGSPYKPPASHAPSGPARAADVAMASRRDAAPVRGAAYSRSGRRILALTSDGHARLWDARRRRLLRDEHPFFGGANSATFSPDGRLFVVAGVPGVGIYDSQQGMRLKTLRAAEPVTAAVFSPDDLRVLTAGISGNATLWDVQRADKLAVLSTDKPVDDVSVVAFSPDGRQVITAGDAKATRVWDVRAQQSIVTIPGNSDLYSASVLSPDATLVAQPAKHDRLVISRTDTGRRLAVIPGSIDGARFSADSRRLVAPGRVGFSVWEVSDWRRSATLGDRRDAGAALSHNGALVLTRRRDGTVRLWHAATGAPGGVLHATGPLIDAAFSPDGTVVATSSSNGAVLWELSTRQPLRMLVGKDVGPGLAFSGDGRFVAASALAGVLVWPTAGGTAPVPNRVVSFIEYSYPSFTWVGGLLAIDHLGSATSFWDGSSGKRLDVPGSLFAALPVVPPGLLLNPRHDVVVTNDRGTASLWQLRSKIKKVVAQSPGDDVQANISPDGRRVITSTPSAVHVFECVACAPIKQVLALARRQAAR